jgi:hypothetical protein
MPAEGFGILRDKADARLPESERFTLDLADIAEVWRRGSVVSSWLLDLTAMALAEDSTLANFSGEVEDSGEGRWTVDAAVEEACPPMFSQLLFSSAFVPSRTIISATGSYRRCVSNLAAMSSICVRAKWRRRAPKRPSRANLAVQFSVIWGNIG